MLPFSLKERHGEFRDEFLAMALADGIGASNGVPARLRL
jgi:hypothetical protein